MAITATAIAGIAAAIATIAGAGIQAGSNAQTRNFNSAEAVRQRDFEERMSSTAFQRGVQDMQEAGINPAMLYATGGDGQASTPNSASASTTPGNYIHLIGEMGSLINSINNARAIDIKSKQKNITTRKMFNDAGELLNAIVESRENSQ